MTFLSIIISALLAFGLGDIVDVIENDDVQSALDVAESFNRANREITCLLYTSPSPRDS